MQRVGREACEPDADFEVRPRIGERDQSRAQVLRTLAVQIKTKLSASKLSPGSGRRLNALGSVRPVVRDGQSVNRRAILTPRIASSENVTFG